MERLIEQFVTCNVETDTLRVAVTACRLGLLIKEDSKTFTAIDIKVSFVERRRALLNYVHAIAERKLHDLAKHDSELEVKACAIQACREGLIKENVCKHFDSMHSEIPSTMRCRYLLQLVHQSLQEKLDIVKRRSLEIEPYQLIDNELDPLKFAKYAEKNGFIEKRVLDYLISLFSKVSCDFKRIYESPKFYKMFLHYISERKSLIETSLNGKNLSLSSPFNIVSIKEELLIAPKQLSNLYEAVQKYAFKWESIGIALNFQMEDLKNIQADPLSMLHAPQRYLCVLLEKWLTKEFNYTLSPSISNLKRALNSQMVGLGSLANKLDKSLCISVVQPALNPPFCSVNVELPFSNLIAIAVKEGLSTILEIQFTVTQCEAYQWLKDGVNYSTGPILCLHQADIDWDGCELSCQIKPKVETPIITVQVSCELDIFRTHLESMYLAQPEVPEDSWPPVSELKYINLALITQSKVDYNSEYARYTIRGNLDDILQDKQIVTYNGNKFYNGLKSKDLVLIEGRPGSGKTTFVHKFTQDWANKSGGAIRLLLLVSLRVLNTFANPDLTDILKLFKGLQVSKDDIERRLGKGVCFVFDGYDEFSPQGGQSSVVHEIINKKYLPHSIVIVASRPAAIAKLRSKAKTVIEVVGFFNEQIIEYVDLYPFKSSTKSAELKTYLELHPNTFYMCYLPIHATMVAFLFEVLGEVLRTETEIYTHFTQLTLIRCLTKDGKIEPINVNLNSLTGDIKICFEHICQLAFDKILSSRQVLKQEELTLIFKLKET